MSTDDSNERRSNEGRSGDRAFDRGRPSRGDGSSSRQIGLPAATARTPDVLGAMGIVRSAAMGIGRFVAMATARFVGTGTVPFVGMGSRVPSVRMVIVRSVAMGTVPFVGMGSRVPSVRMVIVRSAAMVPPRW